MTSRILEGVVIGVLIAVLVALFQTLINELLVPAIREWRERRAAVEATPARRVPRDWAVWVALLVPPVAWILMLAIYGGLMAAGVARP